ncbi:MAG: hypothetical protein N5P05_002272 [Chroococcopsis gigantea SAG 12.99]|jgi:uncharacterized protein (DUF697 family)/GTP-binding protein EngB required for normal cell division|nr:50S ribosome-binding GTPase [Chlorogloea purpurea SAG 13.99]MDV3000666.1 hypothetical protein [Chroococcopsis gigantea SAG 12.99]
MTETSWTNRIAQGWHQTSRQVKNFFPLDKLTGWFNVDEAQIKDILAKVREELPTTGAILIGKPQTGKSSIIRGLTGVSAHIIGQGFRPHTQHTQRYDYPNSDVPLLVFTDTVGLGDVNKDKEEIIQELLGNLEEKTRGAKILILTVKINDFATDSLGQVAKSLRDKYPEIPCLLAVTCLHELYGTHTDNHPSYPPQLPDIERAYGEIQKTFTGLYDRSVLIDFTLEEDEYDPQFYGLETFKDNLAQLLPAAEAKTIHQLLDKEVGNELSGLYRDVARRYIGAFAVAAGALAAIPLPWASLPVLTALQVSMVGLLGKLYGQVITPSQAGGIVSAIAGGFLARIIGRELIKFVPGVGSIIAASWAAGYTWSLGEAACVYFGDLMGGKKPDPDRIKAVMEESFKSAQERFKSS